MKLVTVRNPVGLSLPSRAVPAPLLPLGSAFFLAAATRRSPSLADSRHARNWIISNQLSRRNLTEKQKGNLWGQRYISEKRITAGQPKKEWGHSDLILPKGRTYERIAKELGIGEATVKRDAKFSEAIQVIAKTCGENVCVGRRFQYVLKNCPTVVASHAHGQWRQVLVT